VRYVLPFLVQFWLFITPVIYPASLVPAEWRLLYGLNPMATVVDGFRWCLVGTAPPDTAMILVSIVTVGLTAVGGVWYFRRTEGLFADVI
jgi:homopolymeric O-antigen transport system permease protein